MHGSASQTAPGPTLHSPPPQPHNGPAFYPLPAQTTTPGVPRRGDAWPSGDCNPGGREAGVRVVEFETRDRRRLVLLARERACWTARRILGIVVPASGRACWTRGAFWELWSRPAGERASGRLRWTARRILGVVVQASGRLRVSSRKWPAPRG